MQAVDALQFLITTIVSFLEHLTSASSNDLFIFLPRKWIKRDLTKPLQKLSLYYVQGLNATTNVNGCLMQ